MLLMVIAELGNSHYNSVKDIYRRNTALPGLRNKLTGT